MSYYLISVNLPDDPEMSEKLAEAMAKGGAQRVSQSEWLLRTDPGQVLSVYDRVAAAGNFASLVVQELSEGHQWSDVVITEDILFELLRGNHTVTIDKRPRRSFRSVPFGYALCPRCQGAGHRAHMACADCYGKGLIPLDIEEQSESA